MSQKLLFYLLLFISLVGFSQAAHAQIQVSANQLESMFAAGSSFNFSDGIAPNTVDLGKDGGPNVYDFSGVNFSASETANNYLISSIPNLASRFPGNAVTFGSSPQTIDNNPVFILGPDSMIQIGVASVVGSPDFTISHMVPSEIISIFPAIYGHSFNCSFQEYDTSFHSDWSVKEANYNPTRTYSVNADGYGTIKVGGYQFDCLKIQNGDASIIYLTKVGLMFVVGISNSLVDTGMVNPQYMRLMLSQALVGVNDKIPVPEKYSLSQNYPNPFNPSTTISFSLPERTNVVLSVYNQLGERVAVLFNGDSGAGMHNVSWNAGKFASGVYFYELKTEKFNSVKKLILMK
jgi:hypothetical protein